MQKNECYICESWAKGMMCSGCKKWVCVRHPLFLDKCVDDDRFVCENCPKEKCRKWACECSNHAMWECAHWHEDVKVTCSWGNTLSVRKTFLNETLVVRVDDEKRPSFWLEVTLEGDIKCKGRMESDDGRCNMFGLFDRVTQDDHTVRISDSRTPNVWVRLDFE